MPSCRPLADISVLLISPSGGENVILINSIVYIQHICLRYFGEKNSGWDRGGGGDESGSSICNIHNRSIKTFTIYPCDLLHRKYKGCLLASKKKYNY